MKPGTWARHLGNMLDNLSDADVATQVERLRALQMFLGNGPWATKVVNLLAEAVHAPVRF